MQVARHEFAHQAKPDEPDLSSVQRTHDGGSGGGVTGAGRALDGGSAQPVDFQRVAQHL